MRPFKMFFGLAIGVVLFLFLARVLIFAFFAAVVMSIFYSIYRRIRDFVNYDRYGQPYQIGYNKFSRFNYNRNTDAEPLFYESHQRRYTPETTIHIMD